MQFHYNRKIRLISRAGRPHIIRELPDHQILAVGQVGFAGALPRDDPRRPVMLRAAEVHLLAALPHVADDYMGEHWLASFAVLALDV